MSPPGALELELATHGAQAPFLLLMVSSGVLLGGIVFGLLCVPGLRRPQFRDGWLAPRWFGLTAGGLLSAALGAVGWFQVGTDWSALRIDGDRLDLVYHWPDRARTLERHQVEAVRETIGSGTGNSWHVVLVDRAGHRHQSVAVPPDVSQHLVQALHAWVTPAGPR